MVILSVAYENLTSGYLEVKLFHKLLEIFSYNIAELFLKNYFRFLDDMKYHWKKSIEVAPLWELMNSLHPDIKSIFENVSSVAYFLDVSCLIKNDQLILIFTTNLHIGSLICITATVTRNTLKVILFCHWDKESFE